MKQLYLARFQPFGLIMVIVLVTGCARNNDTTSINASTPVNPTHSVTPVASLTSVVKESATPDHTSTSAATEPGWEIMENWPSANQIRAVLIDQSGDLWTGGPGGVVHWDLGTNKPTIYAIHTKPESTNVIGLSQTPDGTIWASTFGNGLAKFDGTSWQTFTMEDGLPGNYIISQTVSPKGELWLTMQKSKQSMEDSHFGRLDGNKWITKVGGAFSRIVALPDGSIVGTYNYPYHGDFFRSVIGMYDGQVWNDLDVVPDGWIDAVTIAPDGAIWFATLNTVYRYVNQTWIKITPPWAAKEFPQVSSVAVSADDVAWFGFSLIGFDIDQCGSRRDSAEEKGVYRYDGKTWTQFTAEDGLIDNKICAITLDSNGNVWFGSFDKGVSRFDGNDWTSYVIP